MAEPRRVARVSKQLEREIGNLLLYDKVLQKAVCPEKRRGLDSAASAIASVTEVAISSDLQVAKVYVSIFSDAAGKEKAMDQLVKLQGYVRKQIGTTMSLRLTPEVRFIYDESHERGERVLKLLKQIKLQESGEMEPPPITVPRPPPSYAAIQAELDAMEEEEGSDDDKSSDSEEEDEESDEEGGFFDEEDDDTAEASGTSAAFGGEGQQRRQRLSIPAQQQEEPDNSFFGFADPGGAVDAEGDSWLDDEDEFSGISLDADADTQLVGGGQQKGRHRQGKSSQRNSR